MLVVQTQPARKRGLGFFVPYEAQERRGVGCVAIFAALGSPGEAMASPLRCYVRCCGNLPVLVVLWWTISHCGARRREFQVIASCGWWSIRFPPWLDGLVVYAASLRLVSEW